jgi:hypothetical protein
VNFPFIVGNIPAAHAHIAWISQFIRCSIACSSYHEFLDRGLLPTRKLLNQGLLVVKLKSSVRMFYCRHHDLVNRYRISVSQITTDMFCVTNDHGYVLCHKWPRICSVSQMTTDMFCVTNDHGYVPLVVITIRSFPRSWHITGLVTRVTSGANNWAETAHLSGVPEFIPGF